jgi:hypothetical protein
MTTDTPGEGGHCDKECLKNLRERQRILKSTIRIGFGLLNNEGIPDGQGGLGTVVGDRRTIVTAAHIYQVQLASGIEFMSFRTGLEDKDLHLIDINELTLEFSDGGDILTITLPEDLPDDFIPATTAPDHKFYPLQNVSVAYQDENRRLGVFDTELTLTPYTQYRDGTQQYLAKNPGRLVNEGDSGGGVFYNGQFVGVNSFVFQPFINWVIAFQAYK